MLILHGSEVLANHNITISYVTCESYRLAYNEDHATYVSILYKANQICKCRSIVIPLNMVQLSRWESKYVPPDYVVNLFNLLSLATSSDIVSKSCTMNASL